FAFISVGGIESAADVQGRLELGADLVQGYTGFVYFGPFWAKSLTRA
ncbi:MAG: dihydroorotate dehydrogenase (quinone), partial [Aquiluna sp.]